LPILQGQAGCDRGDEVVGFVRAEEDVVVVLLAHRQAWREDEWGRRNRTRGAQENSGRHDRRSRERPAAAPVSGAHATASCQGLRQGAWIGAGDHHLPYAARNPPTSVAAATGCSRSTSQMGAKRNSRSSRRRRGSVARRFVYWRKRDSALAGSRGWSTSNSQGCR